MPIKGTQTERNLLAAFAGESQARNRYTYFSRRPETTASYRSPHFRGDRQPGEGTRQAVLQVPRRGRSQIEGRLSRRHHRRHGREPAGRRQRRTRGMDDAVSGLCHGGPGGRFSAAATVFDKVSVAEKQHERRYRGLLENLSEGTGLQAEPAGQVAV